MDFREACLHVDRAGIHHLRDVVFRDQTAITGNATRVRHNI
ncbi:MAG: hypothetical protein AB8F26_07850 [Phycisphaerales bacterium]